jgi:spore maturation protein CgeB
MSLSLVVLGLSITSSWGNGHATTYRGLLRALSERGHRTHFLERDRPWYAENRDLASPPYCETSLYHSPEELVDRFGSEIAEADVVMIGSYVPDGVPVAEWVLRVAHGLVAFYDIDTPVTLAKLGSGEEVYLARRHVPRFDLYLSFSGGPSLRRLETKYGARRTRPLYCAVDPEAYRPLELEERWLLGYLGTYSLDRQAALEALLIESARRLPAERFAVAGAQYPDGLAWPANVERIQHIPPSEHPWFYGSQRFTLNVTRREMVRAGWSPSVRLFEAAACAVPVVSDWWEGLDTFFHPGSEILVAREIREATELLRDVTWEQGRGMGERARRRVLAEHTPERRAEELERYLDEARRARVA